MQQFMLKETMYGKSPIFKSILFFGRNIGVLSHDCDLYFGPIKSQKYTNEKMQ